MIVFQFEPTVSTHTHNQTRSFGRQHQEAKGVLEAALLETLNAGSTEALLALHGIGKKRAELILEVCFVAFALCTCLSLCVSCLPPTPEINEVHILT